MGLIEELKARKKELVLEMQAIDREAAKVREQYEEMLASLREKRLPLEEKVRMIDKLIESEGGK